MKKYIPLICLFSLSFFALCRAQTQTSQADLLKSTVFNWDKLVMQKTPNGERVMIVNAPTSTLSRLHVHATTLNAGQASGAPRLHTQEELIIIKSGTVEVCCDGKTTMAEAGSIIFFAAHSTTAQRNLGKVPATYYVINYDNGAKKE